MNKSSGILFVLLLLFLIRAAVPTGFMPDFSSGGDWITICSGVEVKTIQIDENGNPVHDMDREPSCPFSFLSSHLSLDHGSFIEIVWFRAEFFNPVILADIVPIYNLYHAGQFILKHAPPTFS